jgi:hypothetical protein
MKPGYKYHLFTAVLFFSIGIYILVVPQAAINIHKYEHSNLIFALVLFLWGAFRGYKALSIHRKNKEA